MCSQRIKQRPLLAKYLTASDEKMGNQSVISEKSSTVYTPTHTTEPDAMSFAFSTLSTNKTAALSPKKTYMIRLKGSGKFLSLSKGKLGVKEHDLYGGFCWNCVRGKDQWLGFQETVSGNFLGHDGQKDFRAAEKHHIPWEYFEVVLDGDQEFKLRSPRGWSLKWVGIKPDGHTLVTVDTSDKAAHWEFLKV
ncbi:hypothetical protein NPX13_g1160 [Xylaria arbuscula]|uniref:Uncharacterized protein n=1 Tax=Xylaria arbuscula TaxID=114810 RepID=A0A9W8TRH0_9PEZI|nr:hypothetical protein NPX13_g1160 [Xylaria arbuscula]